MLSAELRERLSAFRLKLTRLPGILSGVSDLELELAELGRALDSLHDEAQLLIWAVKEEREQERERQAKEAEIPLKPIAPPAPAPLAAQSQTEPCLPPISIQLPQLTGPQVLAWSGGIVTLLGIVFFFVLATNRGWIGPVERVLMGGIASALVFATGVWARRRFEATTSALTAVGAGIAGGYATLLAATALYHFLPTDRVLPSLTALAIAAAIAALGVWTALIWDSETLAVFGLIGAMLVPATMILQSGVTTIGTAFVAAALIAAGVVSLRRRWDGLLVAASAAGAPQIALLVLRHDVRPSSALPVAAVFWLTYVALGVFRQLSDERKTLQTLPVSLLLTSVGVAAVSVARQFHSYADVTTPRGLTLLAVAAGYGAVGAVLFLRRLNRDLASLLIALGLTAAVIAGADLLSGATLAISWAAEAALLGWLAWLTREARFRLSALAYLALALGHVLVVDAPPTHIFTIVSHPATGLTSIVAVILAALVISAFAHTATRPALSTLDFLVCSPVALYGAALALLRLADVFASGEEASFALGHVLVVALLAALSLLFVALGSGRGDPLVRLGGLGLLGVTLAEVVFLITLSSDLRWYGLFPFAGALYGIALAEAALGKKKSGVLSEVAVAALPACAFSAALGLYELAGTTREGVCGLAIAALVALTAVPLARRRELRDASTLFWLVALALGAYDVQLLLSGQALALTLAASALALLALSEWTKERRLELAALTAGVWSLGHVFWFDAPPKVFLQQVSSPLRGLPSLLALIVIALGFAWRLRRETLPRHASSWALVAGGALALLSSWLVVLGIGAGVGSGSTSFDWAQGTATMLLAGSGAVALALGRGRVRPRLWLFGAGAFTVALLKLVALDLGKLNGISRGTVMLALAAFLLVAALAEELLGEELDFARPWAGIAPLNLAAMPVAVVLAVAGIEAVVARAEIAGIDLAASLEIAAGAALFGLALALRLLRRNAATLLGASASCGYLFGLIVLVTSSSVLSSHDIALGLSLTVVLLAVCLRLSGETRILFPLTGAAFAGVVFTLSGWTPPAHLIRVTSDPDSGILVLLALSLALFAAALGARAAEGFDWRRAYSLATAVSVLYAISLLVLESAQQLGGSLASSFERGQVILIALWGVSAIVARELSRGRFRGLSLITFALALGALALFDLDYQWPHLGLYERTAACAALALCALVVSLREQLTAGRPALGLAPLVLAPGSFGLAVLANHEAFGSLRDQGLGLIGLAGLAALLASALYRYEPKQRDFAVLFVAIAVVLAVVGIELTDTIVVFALALLVLLVAFGSLRAGDWRLLVLALVPIAVGLGTSLSGQASPRLIFVASHHPGRGVPALASLIAAGAVLAWAARRARVSDDWIGLVEELSRYLRWAFGVGALYLLSLTVLEIAQAISPGTLASGLQRGHVAISACWGVVGLVFLYLGLTRISRAIRLGGLTLLGASVAKIFLYDLPSLSSVQRAVSFLAVGVMLLAGGFFYQRLAARLTDEQPSRS
ncbi:MAG: DUF2339 domain-containing protein [Gaiellaceae bacterium]